MSANNPFDRRLREAADRADREQQEEQEEEERQLRPGRGTEDRVVEREPSPEPEPEPEPSPEPSTPTRRPDRGARPEPAPEPDPEPVEVSAPEPSPPDRIDRTPDEEPVDIPDVDVQGAVEEAAETFSKGVDVLQETAEQDVLPTDPTAAALGVQEGPTREASPFEQGAVAGVEAFNVPATALGLQAGAEFGAERFGELAAGREEEALEETERATRELLEAAETAVRERPLQTAGAGVSSLALTGGVLGGVSRVSGRAGQAARFGIQPGEEIAGQVGGRTTRAIAGERAAERLFPNNEPLIFSEEAAIRGIDRAVAGASDLRDRIRVRGVAAGVPAIEIETEQEQDVTPQDFREVENRDPLARPERTERRRERARFRGRDRTDLGPNVRARRRPTLEIEQESELAREVETETEAFRAQLGVGVDAVPAEVTGQEVDIEQAIDQETELAREVESELVGETEVAQESEIARELFTETETETRREVEPFGAELFDEEDVGVDVGLEGVRTVEARLRQRELDVE